MCTKKEEEAVFAPLATPWALTECTWVVKTTSMCQETREGEPNVLGAEEAACEFTLVMFVDVLCPSAPKPKQSQQLWIEHP